MIAKHEFNSQWWGQPCGIVTDPALLAAPDRDERLSEFAWVELRASLHEAPDPALLQAAGFRWADVQVGFRLGLRDDPVACLEVVAATEVPADAMRPFEHERFAALQGATPARLADRYGRWAGDLIAAHPDWCVEVRHEGATQGWFLSRPERGLNLALAMLHRDAVVSGADLYRAALAAYARRGARVGWAAFSVSNTGVHNIYAGLGARFTPPVGCWLWAR
jgi:hypothetical protein